MGKAYYSMYSFSAAGRAALDGEIHPDIEDLRGEPEYTSAEKMYRDLIGPGGWEGDEIIVTIDDSDRIKVVGHAFPGDTTERPLKEWLTELRRIDLIPCPSPSHEDTQDTEYPTCPHCGGLQSQWEPEDLSVTHWAYLDCGDCGREMALTAVVDIKYTTRIPSKTKQTRELERAARLNRTVAAIKAAKEPNNV
jgi:hypothetical protein